MSLALEDRHATGVQICSGQICRSPNNIAIYACGIDSLAACKQLELF